MHAKKLLQTTAFLFSAMLLAAGPSPTRPRMIIRLSSGAENPECWPGILEQLKKHRVACDEVWFSTGVGIVPLDTHRKRSAQIATAADQLRGIGIVPSLQIQSTIGHGDGANSSAGRLPWNAYIGRNGEVCRTSSCPRQRAFLEYYRKVASIYGTWQPGSVWVDDDLRLCNHFPAMAPGGCHCDGCLKEFSIQERKSYTRESLLAACAKDSALARRWQLFGEESLAMVANAIAEGMQATSPDTRLALQHCYHPERSAVLEAFHKTTGKRVGSRPGGGAYSDHDPYAILWKGIKISYQIFTQPGYEKLDQIAAEIEDYPRVFSSKTARGHQLEALLYLAMGCDSLSFYSVTADRETPEFYGEQILAQLAREADCYRMYEDHNLKTLPAGIGIAKTYPQIQELGLPLLGIPFASHSPAANCRVLTKSMLQAMNDGELAALQEQNLILDGAAAKEIADRGFSSLLDGILPQKGASPIENYTDDPLNGELKGLLYALSTPFCYSFSCPVNANIRVLSRYAEKENPAATVLLTRKNGTRVALIGLDGFQTLFVSTSRIKFLTRIADWVSHETLPVLTATPSQMLFVPRVTADGTLKSIMAINTVIGHQSPLPLQLRGVSPGTTQAEWFVPGKPSQLLPLQHKDGLTSLILPELEGWEGGWLKL